MRSLRRIPGPPLSSLISCLWYWEGAPQTHSKERLLPTGEASVIFNLQNDPIRLYDAKDLSRFKTYGSAVLSGARSDCFVIDTAQEERVIGIQFLPGGASPFFRMPATEIANDSVALEDLWPSATAEIRERLLAAGNPDCMLRLLERLLMHQLTRAPVLHPAVTYALQRFRGCANTARIADVTDSIGLSSRRFIELFSRQVGLTPKVFCRVRRFQQVLHAVHGKREADWTRIALDCGYYDQAHFIHDFQAFSGLKPSAYLETATLHLNHIPLT